jgi:hypothetical protein
MKITQGVICRQRVAAAVIKGVMGVKTRDQTMRQKRGSLKKHLPSKNS